MMLSLLLLALAVVFIVVATTRFQLHPFLALLAAGLLFGVGSGMPLPEVSASLRDGFGATIGNVGIVIIAGTVIGVFLERSGGAYAIAEAILARIGRRRVPASMSVIGYVTSIPVFADSGFVILQSLNRALTQRAGLSLATTSIALALGLMVTHTLLPPTPGPIAAAAALAADLGLVIAIAAPVSLVVLALSWLWATRVASRLRIDPAPETSETEIAQRLATAPSATRALLPIFLPLALIMLGSVARLPAQPFGDGTLASALLFAGDPVIALLAGMLLAFALPAKLERRMFAQTGWVGEAILSAAVIILVTGAGGAFGRVLLNSGFAQAFGEAMSSWGLGLWLPFAICAVVRAAQGSATVAIITTAGIIAPLLPALGLDSELGRALAVVAIGSGGFFASHANDSFFWVVTQMSGMTPGQGYRLLTAGSCLMALLSGALVWLAGMLLL
ncbi:GntP family permease [Luteimonas sp. RD2P54]|uniref:GntP family permease n=1 Tax=Luteimonas endophytica TaxID=3042023 RepID=A0ABT6J701_9GAMM|nr:GntP family permease [Luteimonas endophytica]MDH5822529.1 GntP family permease [Luteimonas endophytica]